MKSAISLYVTIILMQLQAAPTFAKVPAEYYKAIRYQSSQKFDKAEFYFNRALKKASRKASVYFRLGQLYSEQGLDDRALECYRKAYENEKFSSGYRINYRKKLYERAMKSQQKQDTETMISCYSKLLKVPSKRNEFHSNELIGPILYNSLKSLGRKKEAEIEYNNFPPKLQKLVKPSKSSVISPSEVIDRIDD